MENLNNQDIIEIALEWKDKILQKVWDYFSLEVQNLLIKYEDSFELEKKWRYWFYVKERNTWQLFWVFGSIENEELVDLTTTDLQYFEDVTQ
jgi:hypothetical protein